MKETILRQRIKKLEFYYIYRLANPCPALLAALVFQRTDALALSITDVSDVSGKSFFLVESSSPI